MNTNKPNQVSSVATTTSNQFSSSTTHSADAPSSSPTPVGTFVALEVSYQLIGALREIMPAIRKNDRDLADQILRAASSVSLNIAEGQRSMKGNRLKHYSIAHGSANEVKAGLCVARAWGWIDEGERTRAALSVLDRLLGCCGDSRTADAIGAVFQRPRARDS